MSNISSEPLNNHAIPKSSISSKVASTFGWLGRKVFWGGEKTFSLWMDPSGFCGGISGGITNQLNQRLLYGKKWLDETKEINLIQMGMPFQQAIMHLQMQHAELSKSSEQDKEKLAQLETQMREISGVAIKVINLQNVRVDLQGLKKLLRENTLPEKVTKEQVQQLVKGLEKIKKELVQDLEKQFSPSELQKLVQSMVGYTGQGALKWLVTGLASKVPVGKSIVAPFAFAAEEFVSASARVYVFNQASSSGGDLGQKIYGAGEKTFDSVRNLLPSLTKSKRPKEFGDVVLKQASSSGVKPGLKVKEPTPKKQGVWGHVAADALFWLTQVGSKGWSYRKSPLYFGAGVTWGAGAALTKAMMKASFAFTEMIEPEPEKSPGWVEQQLKQQANQPTIIEQERKMFHNPKIGKLGYLATKVTDFVVPQIVQRGFNTVGTFAGGVEHFLRTRKSSSKQQTGVNNPYLANPSSKWDGLSKTYRAWKNDQCLTHTPLTSSTIFTTGADQLIAIHNGYAAGQWIVDKTSSIAAKAWNWIGGKELVEKIL